MDKHFYTCNFCHVTDPRVFGTFKLNFTSRPYYKSTVLLRWVSCSVSDIWSSFLGRSETGRLGRDPLLMCLEVSTIWHTSSRLVLAQSVPYADITTRLSAVTDRTRKMTPRPGVDVTARIIPTGNLPQTSKGCLSSS